MGRDAKAAGGHVPVLLAEVVAALEPRDGATYVDATFGGGGYSAALLGAAACRVIALDRDPDAIARGAALATSHPHRLTLVAARFGDLDRVEGTGGCAGIAFDLGVSSFQLDEPGRGFSFRADGPLDMRMERAGASAADLVARLPEEELARLIHELGDERHARRVAAAIVAARAESPLLTTGQLAAVVRQVVRPAADGLDPATRTFQALRLAVNEEGAELARGLAAAERALAPGGRLAVVSFHSLEDRMVKAFLRERAGAGPAPSRHLPAGTGAPAPSFRLLSRRPLVPGEGEVAANPRARSARLRVAERTAAPPWSGRPPEAGRPPESGR